MSHQPSKSVEKLVQEVGGDITIYPENGVMLNLYTLNDAQLLAIIEQTKDTETKRAVEEERKRIEAVFIKEVPPHAMDLEDSVWLKRLLNKAFNHK